MELPFGQAVHLWRLHRGWRQEELARAAGMPRPNLSAIERGHRDVSLRTLRALAVALDVRPGVLADGLPPAPPHEAASLPREALERIADAVAFGASLREPVEARLAELLRRVTRHRSLAALSKRGTQRRGRRATEAAWLTLRASYPPALIRTLIQRVETRQRHHDAASD